MTRGNTTYGEDVSWTKAFTYIEYSIEIVLPRRRLSSYAVKRQTGKERTHHSVLHGLITRRDVTSIRAAAIYFCSSPQTFEEAYAATLPAQHLFFFAYLFCMLAFFYIRYAQFNAGLNFQALFILTFPFSLKKQEG